MTEHQNVSVFLIKDCALVAIATGLRAQSLREFRDALQQAPQESVYFHFWGRLLRPRFDDTEFHNDFATWARYSLHDEKLSEQLAVIDPADFADLESLRAEVVEVVEQRLDETESSCSRAGPAISLPSLPDRGIRHRTPAGAPERWSMPFPRCPLAASTITQSTRGAGSP